MKTFKVVSVTFEPTSEGNGDQQTTRTTIKAGLTWQEAKEERRGHKNYEIVPEAGGDKVE